MATETKLHVMIKPPVAERDALANARHRVGLHDKYPAERLHCMMLDLGDDADWTREAIMRLKRAFDLFSAAPFAVAFDRLDGRVLRGQAGMSEANAFHYDLKRWVSLAGFTLPLQIFGLHLSLAHSGPKLPQTMIDPVGWMVDDFRLIRSVHGLGHEELGRWTLERRQFGLAL